MASILEEIDTSIYESKTANQPYGDIDDTVLENKLIEKGIAIVEKGENDSFPWTVRKNNYTFKINNENDIARINNDNTNNDNTNNISNFFAINYELYGGTNSNLNPNTISDDDTVELKNPSREKYEFSGWYMESDFSGEPITTLSNVSSDITLYAKWISKIYFQMPTDWAGDTVYAYMWNKNNETYKNSAWPGVLMTREDTEENSDKYIFSYVVDEDRYDSAVVDDNYTNVIYNNGNSSTRQTVDLEFSENNLCNIFAPELYNGTTNIRVFFSGSTSWNPYLYLWNRR